MEGDKWHWCLELTEDVIYPPARISNTGDLYYRRLISVSVLYKKNLYEDARLAVQSCCHCQDTGRLFFSMHPVNVKNNAGKELHDKDDITIIMCSEIHTKPCPFSSLDPQFGAGVVFQQY